MIAFTVIGGYLGAGKTTLLNNLLSDAGSSGIGLLINDFGEINIDASLIESRTDNQINLTNGCVCCTLVDGFHVAIDQLCEVEPRLKQIVVEASGVADVHNLAQYGYGPGRTLDGVLVVADAETVVAKAKDKYVANTIQRQLKAADLIILNKTDLVSPEKLAETESWLETAFPDARVIKTSFGVVALPLLLGIHEPGRRLDERQGQHAHYATWKHESEAPVARDQLASFLAGLNETVLRAKGIAAQADGTAINIQVVGRRQSLETIESPVKGLQLVAIGLAGKLDPNRLDELAEQCFD